MVSMGMAGCTYDNSSPIACRSSCSELGTKVAAFDLVRVRSLSGPASPEHCIPASAARHWRLQDGTLVTCKSGQEFPGTADDYRFFNTSVTETVQQYQEDGYKVVVFRYVAQGDLWQAIYAGMLC